MTQEQHGFIAFHKGKSFPLSAKHRGEALKLAAKHFHIAERNAHKHIYIEDAPIDPGSNTGA